MAATKIEWAEQVWNFISGCTKVNEGCANCYAEKMTHRLKGMGIKKYQEGWGKVVFHADAIMEPLKRNKPTLYFVKSMSDTFHEKVAFEDLRKAFDFMLGNPQHTFLILTKRPGRMNKFFEQFPEYLADNVWLGMTIVNNKAQMQVIEFCQIKSQRKFISLEPIKEEVDLGFSRQNGVKWAIIGGESGVKHTLSDDNGAITVGLIHKAKDEGMKVFVKSIVSDGKLQKDLTKYPLHNFQEFPEEIYEKHIKK